MMKKCLIISGGVKSIIPVNNRDYFVIACDKGYKYAQEENVTVDLIIGDFDSYNGELPQNVTIDKLPREKDDTDTMHAVRYAIEQGYKDITICCCMGGRIDHMYSNIQTGAYAKRNGAEICLLDDKNEIYYLEAEERRFPRREGWDLSIFSYDNVCEEVSVSGAKYIMNNGTIDNTFPVGQSNEWQDDNIIVKNSVGMMIVIISKK